MGVQASGRIRSRAKEGGGKHLHKYVAISGFLVFNKIVRKCWRNENNCARDLKDVSIWGFSLNTVRDVDNLEHCTDTESDI